MLALVFGACRAGEGPAAAQLVLGQPPSALSLDPHLHDEESTYSTLEQFYERLVAFGPDMQLVPEPALTWQNPSDTHWRIRLRRGVVFHDGRPFGAEDVAATIRRARSLPGSRVAYYLESVADLRALDEATVEIVTAQPSPVLLNKLAFIGIVPRDTPLSPVTRPVGTGPYRFLDGSAGEAIDAERFESYWGPAPAWQRVRFLSFPDARGRGEAVSTRAADAVEARRLLAEAGFPPRGELRLTFANTHADVGRALVRQLGAAGIDLVPPDGVAAGAFALR